MSYHCYLIPYTVKSGKICVLIGKKLCYSSKDGWIHNNPGQYVFIGGGCRNHKKDDKVISSSIREFNEETGNYINPNNIFLKRYNDFAVSFYRISGQREYNFFKSLNVKAHEKYKELVKIKWVSIEKSIILMDKRNKKNLPCYGKLNQNVHKYIKDWSDKKWELKKELKGFKSFLEKRWRTDLYYNQYINIREDIKYNLKRSQNYSLLYDYLIKEFNRRSMIEWYLKSILYLNNHILSIDKSIDKNIQISFKVGKKKSPSPSKQIKKKKNSPNLVKQMKKLKVSPKPVSKFRVNKNLPSKYVPEKNLKGRFERW